MLSAAHASSRACLTSNHIVQAGCSSVAGRNGARTRRRCTESELRANYQSRHCFSHSSLHHSDQSASEQALQSSPPIIQSDFQEFVKSSQINASASETAVAGGENHFASRKKEKAQEKKTKENEFWLRKLSDSSPSNSRRKSYLDRKKDVKKTQGKGKAVQRESLTSEAPKQRAWDPALLEKLKEMQQRVRARRDSEEPATLLSLLSKFIDTEDSTTKEAKKVKISPKLDPFTHAILSPKSRRLIPSIRTVEGTIEHSDASTLEEIDAASVETIATLAHGLDRVLFNQGVHWLQDPRSRVYNFEPHLQALPDIKEFDFDRLPPFIKSSKDETMHKLAVTHARRFAGSTSSLSGLLSHIYFLISRDHPVDTSSLSTEFTYLPKAFTPGQRMPASFTLNYKEGVYLVDSYSHDGDDSQWNVLSWLGTVFEKYLTMRKHNFDKLLRSSPREDAPPMKAEAYRYSKSQKFVMRSQLDSYDPRLPGSGVFDIKTRATLPTRLDNLNFKEHTGYHIRSLHGINESFEKEYYDLIRAAFLKYNFQARIGNMDGMFVAYHNTARMFGFQYIPLEEIDTRLFGANDRGWRVFEKCVKLLEVLVEEIVDCFPGQSLVCMAETLEGHGVMKIWVQPIEALQDVDDIEPDISDNPAKPIVQLDVTVESYLSGQSVDGQKAVNRTNEPWKLEWIISRPQASVRQIHENLRQAQQRQFRSIPLPSGLSIDDIDNLRVFFESLGFNQGQKIPDASAFAPAEGMILNLRALSKAREAERREAAQANSDGEDNKIVWRPNPFTS